VKRILLLLDHVENQHLLAADLASEHEVLLGSADEDLDQEFDLCVVDGASLDRLWERVHLRKEREQPIFLPILLVTSRPDVKMITRHLWRSVDEVIVTPIEKPELRARMEVLLRGRTLSLALRQRAAEAERAARIRDEVLAMVSHDLRNPLNLVMVSGELLLETAPDLSDRHRRQLRLINRAAEQMDRLIQDLLEVSGMEAGHITLHRRPEPVEALMREVCSTMDHAAGARAIRLVCEPDNDLPTVRADRDRLLQVFGNLIGNALKFTPEGGEVRVGAVPEGTHVRFSVADNGPGIDGADLPHVFNRFWQAQRERNARLGGAGLGLAIVRGIVHAHGGEVRAESEVGAGSTFSFTIPAARSTPAGG
jgi:signal transduction histidine kinase